MIKASVMTQCVHAENGCLQVQPDAFVNASDEGSHHKKSLSVKAGTAIVMSDRLLHCSTANASKHTRRAWMPQFSSMPILSRSDCTPTSFAVPLLIVKQ